MHKIGTVSYNIYCNFTNYGSALQTWALHQAIKKMGYEPVLVDYCPEILADMDPLNPFKHMWDKDEESKKMIEMTMPAIYENHRKFENFYHNRFTRTKRNYTMNNFNDVVTDEQLDGFVCGSDTIFCIDEFGFDDGFFANYEVMQQRSVAYAASFGDSHLTSGDYTILNHRICNFKAIGVRESQMIPYLKMHIDIPIERVIDPTLLLNSDEYEQITDDMKEDDKYLLLYARRYSPSMEAYAERLAEKNGWKVIEISLRAVNSEKGHIMAYDAGVEEFLSLVKHAEYVVTNSFHGMIFSVQFERPFVIFTREQCNNKIKELLDLFGLHDRMLVTGKETFAELDYEDVFQNISEAREQSLEFLKKEMDLLKG